MSYFGTSTANDLFVNSTNNGRVGFLLNEASLNEKLFGGVFSGAVGARLYGGCPVTAQRVTASVANGGAAANGIYNNAFNYQMTKATGTANTAGSANITGWSVCSPSQVMPADGSNIGITESGDESLFVFMGSDAQIYVPVTAALVALALPNPINQPLSWNFTETTTQVMGALDVGQTDNYLPVRLLRIEQGYVPVKNATTGAVTWQRGSVGIIRLMALQNPIT